MLDFSTDKSNLAHARSFSHVISRQRRLSPLLATALRLSKPNSITNIFLHYDGVGSIPRQRSYYVKFGRKVGRPFVRRVSTSFGLKTNPSCPDPVAYWDFVVTPFHDHAVIHWDKKPPKLAKKY